MELKISSLIKGGLYFLFLPLATGITYWPVSSINIEFLNKAYSIILYPISKLLPLIGDPTNSPSISKLLFFSLLCLIMWFVIGLVITIVIVKLRKTKKIELEKVTGSPTLISKY